MKTENNIVEKYNEPFCEVHKNERKVWEVNGTDCCNRCMIEQYDTPPEQIDEINKKYGDTS
jgi:hypothetical protein